MCIVLFSDSDDKRECKHLAEVLKPVVDGHSLEVFTRIEKFAMRVRRFPRNIDVAVLSVQNDHQMTALISLSDYYLDAARIILILHDRNEQMISKGHLLRPRFLAFSDNNFSDIAAVVAKMLRNKNSFRPIRERR